LCLIEREISTLNQEKGNVWKSSIFSIMSSSSIYWCFNVFVLHVLMPVLVPFVVYRNFFVTASLPLFFLHIILSIMFKLACKL
jgi:hypothetical protein